LFFLLFFFVSSFWRRARLSGRKKFIGYKQMGFGLFAKDGAYWIWGGSGTKYRTYKMWHWLWGWVCFFPFFFPPSFKIDFAGISPTGSTGCLVSRYSQHYFRLSRTYLGCHQRSTKQKKRWYQKNGLGATGEFFYMKGYGFFYFSYESFFYFCLYGCHWVGVELIFFFYILVTFFLAFQLQAIICVCFIAVSCCLYLWCKVYLGYCVFWFFPSQVLLPRFFLNLSLIVCFLPLIPLGYSFVRFSGPDNLSQ